MLCGAQPENHLATGSVALAIADLCCVHDHNRDLGPLRLLRLCPIPRRGVPMQRQDAGLAIRAALLETLRWWGHHDEKLVEF